MVHYYAVINDAGKCYQVYKTTIFALDRHHVPIDGVSIDYLSKYYYPIPDFVDSDADFCGDWYYDVEHKIKEVTQ